MRSAIAVVLGGGQGTRLMPLTKYRSKPAVPLAGKYRLIDIPLSNCLNSDLNRIYVLTQFLSVSLHRHIRGTYRFDNFSAGFVEILAAQQTMAEGTDWYQGTADAVRKNLRYLTQPGTKHVVILSGDQLYHMDFRDMLRTHRQMGAEITIAAKPVHRHEAHALGIMQANDMGRVTRFAEKPTTEELLNSVRTAPGWIDSLGVASQGREFLASMGIYVFNVDVLRTLLEESTATDFGREIFPAAIDSRKVHLHLFDGYWEDIGTIKSFYDANLQLNLPSAPYELNAPNAPIYSRPRFLPPSRIDGAHVERSLLADGCVIEPGARIENSVIGLRCRIGRNVTIKDSIVMGADYCQLAGTTKVSPESPALGIGDGAVIERAIVDKNCRIGPGAQVVNTGDCPEGDVDSVCVLRDGILVVEKDACLRANWHV